MQYSEVPGKGMVAMDGKRLVAVARKNHHGWMLTGYGVCFADQAARTPNIIGRINAQLWLLKTAKEARRIIKAIVATGQIR